MQKMKLSLITMQGVYNYGSALQTYASQKILTDLGCEVEIVDYYPNRMRNYGSLKQLYTDASVFCTLGGQVMTLNLIKMKKRIKIRITMTFVIVILMSLCGSRFVFQKTCVRRKTSWLNMGTADNHA